MLTYDLSTRGEDPLYVALYKHVKADVESGAIAPHEKLPSKRALARNLGVGVITVEAAYAQLIAEGYLYAETRRGYFACDILAHAASSSPAAPADAAGMHAPDERPATGGAYADRSSAPRIPQRSATRNGRGDETDADARDRMRTEAPGPHRGGIGNPTPASGGSRSTSSAKRRAEPAARRAHAAGVGTVRFDLASGAAAERSFPFSTWAKALRDTLSDGPKEALVRAGDPCGTERLRRAICRHLRQTRGLDADPACVVVGAGAQVLYNLVVQLLGRPACIGLEDPGYSKLASIYECNGLSVEHLPLDSLGIRTDAVRASDVRLLHITPSHQFPTGIVMPASRRYELLAWATESDGRYILEDDYDCEFRLAGKPVPTLQGIDRSERVIYANTFSKSLGPAFRIAYLVLPDHLARAWRERLGFYTCTVPAIDQMALARFIERGDLERFVNRTKTRCRTVRDTLVGALMNTPAARRLSFEGLDSGLHFVMGIDARGTGDPDEDAALDRAMAESIRRQDVAVEPLSRYCSRPAALARASSPAPGRTTCRLVVSYAALPAERARAAAEALSRGIAPFL